jgi:hypothetical protein
VLITWQYGVFHAIWLIKCYHISIPEWAFPLRSQIHESSFTSLTLERNIVSPYIRTCIYAKSMIWVVAVSIGTDKHCGVSSLEALLQGNSLKVPICVRRSCSFNSVIINSAWETVWWQEIRKNKYRFSHIWSRYGARMTAEPTARHN